MAKIDIGDKTKTVDDGAIIDYRGVVEYGNLMKYKPFDGGYVLLACLNGPAFINEMSGCSGYDSYYKLQKLFIKALEFEFKGLDGIDDITTETMDISDNTNSVSLISKVTRPSVSQITMRYTEKTGTLFSKYLGMYLNMIKDTKTQYKNYAGFVNTSKCSRPRYEREVFNFLYIITDSTYKKVEKAYLILNAQPTSSPLSELYNTDKGEFGTKEIGITFNATVIDGITPHKVGQYYVNSMVNASSAIKSGKINVNSWNYNWKYSRDNSSYNTSKTYVTKTGAMVIDPTKAWNYVAKK